MKNYNQSNKKSLPLLFSDLNEFQALVLWLEEQKIRRYSVASGERNDLRNFESNQWQQYFDKYVTDLKCPASSQENNVQALCWILGYTLRLEAKHGSERASDIPMTFLDNIDSKLYYILQTGKKFTFIYVSIQIFLELMDMIFLTLLKSCIL